MAVEIDEARWNIELVSERDLVDLLPLMRAYCEFYYQTEQIPVTSDNALMSISRALISNPMHEGIQLIVRDAKERIPVAFATIFWSWCTLTGGRLAIMNDLYVDEKYRGQGIVDMLIKQCEHRAREHKAVCLAWETSIANHRAQAVYARTRALKSHRWLTYTIDL